MAVKLSEFLEAVSIIAEVLRGQEKKDFKDNMEKPKLKSKCTI